MLPVLLTRTLLPQLSQAKTAGILNIGSGYDRIGTAEHSIDAIPKSRLLPQLGMLLSNSTPTDRKAFYAGMPFSVKVLWRLMGKRQYAKQFQLLFPGRPVPPTI